LSAEGWEVYDFTLGRFLKMKMKKKQNKLVDWNKLTNLIQKSNYSGNFVVPASMTALKG
jgi:hypothetical protein